MSLCWGKGWPQPVEQAAVLLEVCDGDLAQAKEFCSTNIRHANDANFWYRVLDTLNANGSA